MFVHTPSVHTVTVPPSRHRFALSAAHSSPSSVHKQLGTPSGPEVHPGKARPPASAHTASHVVTSVSPSAPHSAKVPSGRQPASQGPSQAHAPPVHATGWAEPHIAVHVSSTHARSSPQTRMLCEPTQTAGSPPEQNSPGSAGYGTGSPQATTVAMMKARPSRPDLVDFRGTRWRLPDSQD